MAVKFLGLMNKYIFVCIFFFTGCSGVPSIKYCDDVSYVREDNKIHVEANCKIPMQDGSMDIQPKDIMMGIMGGMLL